MSEHPLFSVRDVYLHICGYLNLIDAIHISSTCKTAGKLLEKSWIIERFYGQIVGEPRSGNELKEFDVMIKWNPTYVKYGKTLSFIQNIYKSHIVLDAPFMQESMCSNTMVTYDPGNKTYSMHSSKGYTDSEKYNAMRILEIMDEKLRDTTREHSDVQTAFVHAFSYVNVHLSYLSMYFAVKALPRNQQARYNSSATPGIETIDAYVIPMKNGKCERDWTQIKLQSLLEMLEKANTITL